MSNSENQSKQIANKEFHQLTGGRKRYDLRFYDDPKAVETRELITQIQERRQYQDSLLELSEEIGVSNSTLSLALGGRAGKKPQHELGGLSSTDFIISRLRQFNQD